MNDMRNEPAKYDPSWISTFYGQYGDREWSRLSQTPADRVNFAIHVHYLRRFVKPESRVLEIGSGPGRFTQVLGALGCRVLVSDISEVQLQLHRKHSLELDFEGCVEDRQHLDVCDLRALDSESFDAVLCYGGPLSYVFDQAAPALRECARVCRPGGRVLASVMSLWGSCHRLLPAILQIPVEANQRVTATGDLTPENWAEVKHRCHMFRSAEVRDLAVQAGLHVLAMSASNCLSINWDECLSEFDDGSESWNELLRMEIEACQEAGCLDAGTHIILVARKE